jgi:hypothetical protein
MEPLQPDTVVAGTDLNLGPAEREVSGQDRSTGTQRRAGQERRTTRESQRGERELARQERSEEEPATTPKPVTPQPSVRFEAVVYRLTMSTENAVRIDAAEVAEQPTLMQFDEALRGLGEAQLLYRVDQTVALHDDERAQSRRGRRRIMITADQPYVSGSTRSEDGGERTSIARRDIGVVFELAGMWVGDSTPEVIQLTLNVQLSALEPSGVRVGPDLTSPVFRDVEQMYSGDVEPGKPIVLLSLDGATADADGRAVAYMTRARLSRR